MISGKKSMGLNNKSEVKSESDIEALIRSQLKNAGFDSSGNHDESERENEVKDLVKVKKSTNRPVRVKVIDNRFIRLEELPSNFYPYLGRSFIMVRPFSVLELKLIARSIETNSIDYITQAIDNCIDMDVYDLTIPDYFFLYYWFRIESYPSTPHYMEWVCDETSVVEEQTRTCGYENTTPLRKSDIKVVHLDDLEFKQSYIDPSLDFPRVRLLEDLTQASEDKSTYSKVLTPDDEDKLDTTFKLDDLLLVDAAKWIKDGDTIFDKLKILESQPDLALYELASKTNKAMQFGVYEYTIVSCGRCGAKRRYKVLLDAPRFFPFIN